MQSQLTRPQDKATPRRPSWKSPADPKVLLLVDAARSEPSDRTPPRLARLATAMRPLTSSQHARTWGAAFCQGHDGGVTRPGFWWFLVVFGGFCIGLRVFCWRLRVRIEKLID